MFGQKYGLSGGRSVGIGPEISKYRFENLLKCKFFTKISKCEQNLGVVGRFSQNFRKDNREFPNVGKVSQSGTH